MNATVIKLHIYNPAVLFLGSLLGYAVLWMIAPISFIFSGNFESVIIFIVYAGLFTLGLSLGFRRWGALRVPVTINVSHLQRFAFWLTVLGLCGVVLHVYSNVFLRGEGVVTANFMTNRALYTDGGSSAFSFVALLLSAMLLFVPPVVQLLVAADRKRLRYISMLLASLSFPLFSILLQGSLSTLLIYVALFFAGVITVRGFKLRLGWILKAAITAIILMWIAGEIFVLRTSDMGLNPVVSMTASAYAEFAPASGWVLSLLNSGHAGIVNGLLYAYVHICQYFLHGLYEFFYAASHVAHPRTHGLISFYIPAKMVFTAAGGAPVGSVITQNLLRPGVYTTLLGPLLYDFGPLGGAFSCLIFGVGAGCIARSVRHKNLTFFPLYCIIAGFLPLAMVLNLFVSATGQYLLILGCVLVLVLKMKNFSLTTTKRLKFSDGGSSVRHDEKLQKEVSSMQ